MFPSDFKNDGSSIHEMVMSKLNTQKTVPETFQASRIDSFFSGNSSIVHWAFLVQHSYPAVFELGASLFLFPPATETFFPLGVISVHRNFNDEPSVNLGGSTFNPTAAQKKVSRRFIIISMIYHFTLGYQYFMGVKNNGGIAMLIGSFIPNFSTLDSFE